MARVEGVHWWWTARRSIIDTMIARMGLPQGAQILEGGCGTGGNLAMLARHGSVHAFEPDAGARALALQHGNQADVRAGSLPDDVSVADGSMHLVALFDVLEHIDDDHRALARLRRCLRPRGQLLLTVPAAPWLWSSHDVVLHHRRRYTLASAIAVVRAAGFSIRYASHANALLLPIAVAERTHAAIFKRAPRPAALPPAPVNRLLRRVFAAECRFHAHARARLPYGLSIIIWAERGP
ncbi:MAG: class I SAM-dependent methyltransferase [Planctomycetes bacterium]|nr:class I SAM-dependent methyltransferase [Planctomycetota bacterium]